MNFHIAVMPGDGIGPEVIAEGVKVLDTAGRAFGHTFSYTYDDVGGAAIDKYGAALRPETLEMARNADAVLFGAVGGPKWDDPAAKVRPEDAILGIRKELKVFANLRPVRVLPELAESSVLRPEVLQGVDITIIRELTGGLYYGLPKKRTLTKKRGWTGVDTMRYSQREIERVLRVGFELARGRRGMLTSVDKANVLETSRLWRQVAGEVGAEYPDVELEHMLVDTCAMQLMQRPAHFDVIVTENTFGDILTDEAAVLAASMGVLPSASLADIPREGVRAKGLYEPIHGTAPDIAGQGVANPIATVLSVALMMRYSLGLTEEAVAVERAVARVVWQGYRTPDISTPADARPATGRSAVEKPVGTVEMGDLIAAAL